MFRVTVLQPSRKVLPQRYKTRRGAERLIARLVLTHWELAEGSEIVGWRTINESHPKVPSEAPCQVRFHGSAIMAEHRRDEAHLDLERLAYTAEIMREVGMEPTLPIMLGGSEPAVPIGRTAGPTHTRRGAALMRIRTNSAGLNITRERVEPPKPRLGVFAGLTSHLDPKTTDRRGLITGLED